MGGEMGEGVLDPWILKFGIFLINFRKNPLDAHDWNLSIRKSGLTFRALRISQLYTSSLRVTPEILRKYPISAACT